MKNFFFVLLFTLSGIAAPRGLNEADKPLTLERLTRDTFIYFWETTDKHTGLAPDRFPSQSPASIAAVSFALTSYPIGVENAYITRKQAVDRTLNTLRFFWSLPLGPEKKGAAGYRGFYYHFLKMTDGSRSQDWEIELSTVDTALLMAGVLFSQSYFDGPDKNEFEIRTLADKLYKRVDWQWAQNHTPLISHGWFPDKGFLEHDWTGYNEAMLVYILALGSPTYAIGENSWKAWTANYHWAGDNGNEHLTFAPMFGHQYSHIWIDFRDIQDDYMKERNSDYFLNSKKAAYAQRQYAILNPEKWDGYGENLWGLTACDGPGKFVLDVNGKTRKFMGYSARGVGQYSFDDGTLAPTALIGSLPFAPEIILPAIQSTYNNFGKHIYTNYGFLDSYNPSFKFDMLSKVGKVVPNVGWVANDYIGIDQGAILAMVENHQSELIWKTMRKNPYIKRGLKRAGFTGGWLENQKDSK